MRSAEPLCKAGGAHGSAAPKMNRRSRNPLPLAPVAKREVGPRRTASTNKVIKCSAALDPVAPEAAALRARAPP